MHRLALLAAFLLVAGCDLHGSDGPYPDALDLPEVTIPDLRTVVARPGRYNVEAVVLRRTECYCPDNAMCAPCEFLDGAIVSADGARLPDDGYDAAGLGFLSVAADAPEAFEIGARYLLSVEVPPARPASQPVRTVDLLGLRRLSSAR